MAHSSAKHSSLSSLLFVLFLCFVVSSCSARTVQIGDICSKHINPSNCFNIINTVPGASSGADIDSLSSYIINLAHVNAFDTLTLIHDLIGKTTNHQLIQRYSSCSMDYNDVLLSLSQAQQSHNSKDFSNMKSNAGTALKDVQDCDSKAPADPSTLRKNNKYLEDVSMIIMILADFLAGKY